MASAQIFGGSHEIIPHYPSLNLTIPGPRSRVFAVPKEALINSPPDKLPLIYPFELYRGDTRDPILEYTHKAAGVVVNLTGIVVRLHVRDGAILLLERSSVPNGGIVVTPLLGKVVVRLTSSDWTTITWTRGSYDLEYLYPDGTAKTWLRGGVKIVGDQTR